MRLLREWLSTASLDQRRLSTLLLFLLGVVILVSYLGAGAAAYGTEHRDVAFSTRDVPLVQVAVPMLDSPFTLGWLPSNLLGRASIAVALGRRTALRDCAAAASALAVVLFAALLLEASVPVYPALLTTLAFACGATFWRRAVSWSGDVLSPIMALAAVLVIVRWRRHGGTRLIVMAGVCATLATLEDPLWAGGLPAVALLIASRPPDAARRVATIFLVAIAVAALAAFFVRFDAIRGGLWSASAGLESPGVWTMWKTLMHAGWIPPTTLLAREFTSIGQVLVVCGLVICWHETRHRVALTLFVIGLVVARYLTPQADPRQIGVPLAIAGWASVAFGVMWLGRTIPGASVTAGAVIAALVLQPLLTRQRVARLNEADPAWAEARNAFDVRIRDFPADAAILATSRTVDAALRLSADLIDRSLRVVPQDPTLLQSALGARQQILAFPTAYSSVAASGFVFERSLIANSIQSVLVGRQPCSTLAPDEWNDVSLQLDGAAFSLQADRTPRFPGQVLIYMAAPWPVGFGHRGRATLFDMGVVQANRTGAHRQALETALTRARVPNHWPITSLLVTVTNSTEAIFDISEVPAVAIARSNVPAAVTLCAAAARQDIALAAAPDAVASARLFSGTPFPVGWHVPEGGDNAFRWTAASESSVRVHVARPGPIRVTVAAASVAAPSSGPYLGLAVNACEFDRQPITPLQGEVSWTVRADCWKPGANELWLRSGPLISPAELGGSDDRRLLGARIDAIRFERVAR